MILFPSILLPFRNVPASLCRHLSMAVAEIGAAGKPRASPIHDGVRAYGAAKKRYPLGNPSIHASCQPQVAGSSAAGRHGTAPSWARQTGEGLWHAWKAVQEIACTADADSRQTGLQKADHSTRSIIGSRKENAGHESTMSETCDCDAYGERRVHAHSRSAWFKAAKKLKLVKNMTPSAPAKPTAPQSHWALQRTTSL